MKVLRSVSFAVAILMTLAAYQGVFATQQTTVAVSFSQEQLLFDHVRGYHRVRLMDGTLISRMGEPVLPAKQIMVAIPSDTEAIQVRVLSLASEGLTGTYQIFPGQPPARLDGSPRPPFVEPDEQVYSSNVVYPRELGQLVGQTDLAGQQMAAVTVYPLQYVPATGKLILHREMEITVETRHGRVSQETYARFTEKQRRIYGDMIGQMVINPQDVALNPSMREPSKALPAGDFDHVVITDASYTSYFDDLVEWHNKRGLRDTVVTTSYIYGNYSGSDNQERIRNFVIDAQSTWGTLYFLMGGEDETVPFKYRTYYGENTPSDNYYADHDDDWTCEAFVGRLSGSTELQLQRAVDKILNYEKNPPLSGYPLDVLLIGMDLDPSTLGQDLKETIDGYIPSRFNVTKVYDSDGTNHRIATVDALNAGQNLVNHADHANSTVLGTGSVNHGLGLSRTDVNNLTNDNQLSNVVSLGCWANDMTYDDGIAERFVIYNPNQAGVSFTGNTRDGWGYVGSPESLSGQLDRDWWRGLFNYSQHLLGQALVWSKHQFSTGGYDGNLKKHCEWTFSLLGDPAMPLWTDTPESLDVTHPSTLPLGSSSFAVHVESGGSNVSGAYVCLWKQGDLYLTGSTNSSGNVTFNPSPATAGIMCVTVTKHDYLPREGSAQATSGGPPPPITDLGIALSQQDLVLTWSPSEEKAVVRYVVYRNTVSDFVPAPGDSIGGTANTTYTDVGAAGSVGTNYFYAVKAVSDSQQKSDPSHTVGEFDSSLMSEPLK